MLNIHSSQRGLIVFWMLAIIILAVWGLYSFSQKVSLFGVGEDNSTNDTTYSTTEAVDEKNENSTTRSFTTVNGYDTSRGKAVITEDKFGYFTISIAATMPSEFPGTYYEAKIIGAGMTTDVNLGKMSKMGGSFTAQYVSARVIDDYYQVVISVDGEAATVEGKTLPHDVMTLDL